jgi:hypothetical protein
MTGAVFILWGQKKLDGDQPLEDTPGDVLSDKFSHNEGAEDGPSTVRGELLATTAW